MEKSYLLADDQTEKERYNQFRDIDENALSKVDRLGLASCRLNSWEWDEYIGPKPEGFDELPLYDLFEAIHPIWSQIRSKLFPRKYPKIRTREDYIFPAMQAIESEIGEAATSRCWWVFGLKKTEEEWRRWYYTEHFKERR